MCATYSWRLVKCLPARAARSSPEETVQSAHSVLQPHKNPTRCSLFLTTFLCSEAARSPKNRGDFQSCLRQRRQEFLKETSGTSFSWNMIFSSRKTDNWTKRTAVCSTNQWFVSWRSCWIQNGVWRSTQVLLDPGVSRKIYIINEVIQTATVCSGRWRGLWSSAHQRSWRSRKHVNIIHWTHRLSFCLQLGDKFFPFLV